MFPGDRSGVWTFHRVTLSWHFNTAPALPCSVGTSPRGEGRTEEWVIGCGGEGWGVGENILGKETPVWGNFSLFFSSFFLKMVLVHLKNKNALKYVGH